MARESLGLYDEYFTISANGVMTIRKGVQAEFVPLAEWVRQQSLFDSVSAIGFYKKYITGRAFRRWHSVSVPQPQQPLQQHACVMDCGKQLRCARRHSMCAVWAGLCASVRTQQWPGILLALCTLRLLSAAGRQAQKLQGGPQ